MVEEEVDVILQSPEEQINEKKHVFVLQNNCLLIVLEQHKPGTCNTKVCWTLYHIVVCMWVCQGLINTINKTIQYRNCIPTFHGSP